MDGKRDPFVSRGGFTLIEMIIFVAIFSLAMMGFITIFTAFLRVQSRQAAESEVNQQSQFLLTAIQQQIENSSIIDIPLNTATTTLVLRPASTSNDITRVFTSSSRAYFQFGSNPAQPLTSSRVSVQSLTFTKRSNYGARDTVQIAFVLRYSGGDVNFSRQINYSAPRTSSASFDDYILPSFSSAYKLGVSSSKWASINDTIYFSGENVGIKTVSPTAKLEVNGGFYMAGGAKPTCDSSSRGAFWTTAGGAGVKDSLQVCVKSAAGTYSWHDIY